MSKENPNQAPDPRLVKLIQLLHPVPERNRQAIQRGKTRFLSDLEEYFPEPKTRPSSPLGWVFRREKGNAPRRLHPRLALTTVMIIATLVVFLAGGAGLTVYAAQKALPGDTLYPVKTGVEQTRITLTSDHYRLAAMHLALAQERLSELEVLVQDKRFAQVGPTAAEFERHIQMALADMQQLANEDPGRASQLSVMVTGQLNRYIQALSEMANGLPEAVKAEVEQSIVNTANLGNPPEAEDHGEGSESNPQQTIAPEQGNTSPTVNSNEVEAPETEQKASEAATPTPANTSQGSNDHESEASHESGFSFTGQVEKMSSEAWVVKGIELAITPNTVIEPGITIGAEVEVKAWKPAGQPAQAIEIRLSHDENPSGDDDSSEPSDESGHD